jgi:methylmalonyl-CoA mutase cobalamin-binding subunit
MTARQSLPSHKVEAAATALAIEANFDAITKAAFNYRRRQVYRKLRKRGMKVVLLSGKKAVRQAVAAAAIQDETVLLTGVGHGKRRTFCGYENEAIFRVGKYNAEEVRGKVIHLLSCFPADGLGRDFRAKGCRAFFGYREEFAVPFEDLSELDELAESFFGSDAEIDLAFAEGVPLKEILERVRRKFDENIARLNKLGKRESSAVLESNRDLLIALIADGDAIAQSAF